ncbi:type II secretion system protein [Planctomycetota bacterium]
MYRRGFTLIELLVVIAIIALLMAILMPSLQRVRKQSQAVACMSNLKQWGLIWYMYTEDNDYKFPTGSSVAGDATNDWPVVLWDYYMDRGSLTLCPSATKEHFEGVRYAFGAWNWTQSGGWTGLKDKQAPDYGSYGQNEWICNRPLSVALGERYWRTRIQKYSDKIPIFLDCAWMDLYPSDTDGPAQIEEIPSSEMSLVCIDRHSGYVNTLFIDCSTVRKVGLKELWTLKWYRTFDNTTNVWTKGGGVQPEDWPEWMRSFKDY